MALVNVRNRLGVKFTVTGVYLFPARNDNQPDHERTARGDFTVTVDAVSAHQAMVEAAQIVGYDITVHSVTLG